MALDAELVGGLGPVEERGVFGTVGVVTGGAVQAAVLALGVLDILAVGVAAPDRLAHDVVAVVIAAMAAGTQRRRRGTEQARVQACVGIVAARTPVAHHHRVRVRDATAILLGVAAEAALVGRLVEVGWPGRAVGVVALGALPRGDRFVDHRTSGDVIGVARETQSRERFDLREVLAVVDTVLWVAARTAPQAHRTVGVLGSGERIVALLAERGAPEDRARGVLGAVGMVALVAAMLCDGPLDIGHTPCMIGVAVPAA